MIEYVIKWIVSIFIICIGLYFATGLVLRAIRDFKMSHKEEDKNG